MNPQAYDLHALVAEKLMGKEIDYNRLHFYTTVNSHLDIFNSTDAIFEYYSNNKDLLARVSIDLKTKKESGPHVLYFPEIESDKLEELLVKEKLAKLELFEIKKKNKQFIETQAKIDQIKKERKDLIMPYLKQWSSQITELMKIQM